MPAPRVRDLETGYKLVELRREEYKEAAAALAAKLWNGEISITQWRKEMQREIKDLHSTALIISRGGEYGSVTQADWGRLGRQMRDQYAYLNKYQKTLEESAHASLLGLVNFKSETYVANRSGLYGNNARATFWRGVTYGLLPQVPGDGRTACTMNCGCHLDIREGDDVGTVFVYWLINPALENCPDCEVLSQQWNPLTVQMPEDMVEAGDNLGLDLVAVMRQVLTTDKLRMYLDFKRGGRRPFMPARAAG